MSPAVGHGCRWRADLSVAEATATAALVKHERQTVAMELVAALHHSRDVGPGTNAGPRAQKAASSREVEAHETHSALRGPKQPPHGERPGSLLDPGPQRSDRTARHSVGNGLPLLATPSPAGAAGEAIDSATLTFLLSQSLRVRQEHEEEHAAMRREEKRVKKEERKTEMAVVRRRSGVRRRSWSSRRRWPRPGRRWLRGSSCLSCLPISRLLVPRGRPLPRCKEGEGRGKRGGKGGRGAPLEPLRFRCCGSLPAVPVAGPCSFSVWKASLCPTCCCSCLVVS